MLENLYEQAQTYGKFISKTQIDETTIYERYELEDTTWTFIFGVDHNLYKLELIKISI